MNQRARVVIADFIAGPLEMERRILGEVAEIVALDAASEDELRGKIEDADAIMMYHTVSITEKTIDRLKHCKLIVRCGVGYDNVDWRLGRQRGSAVANVPDYGTEEVADSAIGMTLALARGIQLFNSRLRDSEGDWMYTQAQPVW
jgi:D-3-phosphoglycerate dehydrogenase/C-terminal binding protein